MYKEDNITYCIMLTIEKMVTAKFNYVPVVHQSTNSIILNLRGRTMHPHAHQILTQSNNRRSEVIAI